LHLRFSGESPSKKFDTSAAAAATTFLQSIINHRKAIFIYEANDLFFRFICTHHFHVGWERLLLFALGVEAMVEHYEWIANMKQQQQRVELLSQ